MHVYNDGVLETDFQHNFCRVSGNIFAPGASLVRAGAFVSPALLSIEMIKISHLLPSLLLCPGLNSRSPLSETKSTSSSLSALSDSLNSSEGGDLTHGNEELRGLLAPPSSAGSQSSSGSHSGSGTEDKSDKGKESWELLRTHTLHHFKASENISILSLQRCIVMTE